MYDQLTPAQLERLAYDWDFWARDEQKPPPGDWSVWLIKTGRGWGKTRTGAGWVHRRAMEFPKRWIAIVARTPADARDFMIEGPSGLLRNTHPRERPHYEPSKRRITWPNGSWATVYSDDEPDQIRGFSGDTAWLDEFAKFKHPVDVWNNLQFGMRERSSDRPRSLITTTPRPLKILKDILGLPDTVVVAGSSYENRENLDERWFASLTKFEGTRIGRQEIHGEILEDVSGALWNRSLIEQCRVRPESVPSMRRIVVAIDPSATSGEDADEAGIVCVGLGQDGHGYVLEDASERMSPTQWAERAVRLYETHKADRIIGEVNNGGEMVETTLRVVSPGIPFRAVHASRGKVTRAEPASALYERGLVHHVGAFPALEDQLCAFTTDFNRATQGYSPDRLDALVWALTELMLQQMTWWGVYEFTRQQAEGEEIPLPSQMQIPSDTPLPSEMKLQLPSQMLLPPPNYGFSFAPKKFDRLVTMKVPKGISNIYGKSGQPYIVHDGVVRVSPEDAQPLVGKDGFERVA